MIKHTPKPWIAKKSGSQDLGVAYEILAPWEHKSGQYVLADILTVEDVDGDDAPGPGGYDLANAMLMAAGPELLAVCQAIAADSRLIRLHTKHQQQLLAAIAKATGEEVAP